MSEVMDDQGVDGIQAEDAFVAFGLVSPCKAWSEQIGRRLQVLNSFSSDLERFAFLSDLHTSNPVLLEALFRKNEKLAMIYAELNVYLRSVTPG